MGRAFYNQADPLKGEVIAITIIGLLKRKATISSIGELRPPPRSSDPKEAACEAANCQGI